MFRVGKKYSEGKQGEEIIRKMFVESGINANSIDMKNLYQV